LFRPCRISLRAGFRPRMGCIAAVGLISALLVHSLASVREHTAIVSRLGGSRCVSSARLPDQKALVRRTFAKTTRPPLQRTYGV
jgi:hypothetical protein